MAEITYKPRIADRILQDRLEEAGAVLIQGPKWCGKTTTAMRFAGSQVLLANPDTLRRSRQLAETNLSALLGGDTPRLFDEWQTIPDLWDSIRSEVDMRRKKGQFILTGSAVPYRDKNENERHLNHSGIGRYARLRMRPMSLWESGESTGEVSLKALFEGQNNIFGTNKWNLFDIVFMLCRGGWPDTLSVSERVALRTPYNYVEALAESDMSRVDNTFRNPNRVHRLLRSLARLQGTQTNISVIRDDMRANDDATLSETTIASYLSALESIFVVEDMQAWSTHLRSKTAIRTSNTRYFVDPSIAVASLRTSPTNLMQDIETLGLLFETMAVRDLRVYAEALDGKVFHYRDKTELECDAVIELSNGKYGLVEIKLGGTTAQEEAQKSLNKLAGKIDISKAGSPAFRMVLTAVGEYAYTLKDGTHIVPIGCLKD
ncbi:MAG: ATP-binding protein [Paludibacteraceae bacterium]|nr:ATP-binding protein [Paludibacteraceae bacterium]